MSAQPPKSFQIEYTDATWRAVQEQGSFPFNVDGDSAKRVEIVLSDYDIEDISGQYDDPNEAQQKQNAVKLQFTRKRGA